MKQRGRKSADLLALPAVEVPRPQLEPPRSLTKAERLLFTELAANAPHLKPSDAPLLVSYVQATIASRRSARDPSKANLWEKATRLNQRQLYLADKYREKRLLPASLTELEQPVCTGSST